MKNKISTGSLVKLGLVLSLPCAILSGCGGGGGGDSAGSSKTDAQAGVSLDYDAVKPAVGDWVMYRQTWTNQTANPPVAMTPRYRVRNYLGNVQNEAFTFVDTSADEGTYSWPKFLYQVDLSTGFTTSAVNETIQQCTYSPGYMATYQDAPGLERFTGKFSTATSWNQASRATCIDQTSPAGLGSNVTSKGAITAIEKVTAGGVEYLAAKETFELMNVFDLQTGVQAHKTTTTCWRDTVLGRNVKCDISFYIKSESTGPDFKLQTTFSHELIGYKLQGFAPKAPPVSPYAGIYKLTYDSSTCDSIRINYTGAISGNCAITSAGAISGQVQADGTISFKTAGNATFDGKMVMPMSGSGNYTKPDSSHGTWSLTHH